MSEKIISEKDVQHVAALSRLAVTPEDIRLYQGQLERILGYMNKLKEKNTDSVAPTAHPFEAGVAWRDDEAKPFADIPALFRNAPEKEETFFKVKKVIES